MNLASMLGHMGLAVGREIVREIRFKGAWYSSRGRNLVMDQESIYVSALMNEALAERIMGSKLVSTTASAKRMLHTGGRARLKGKEWCIISVEGMGPLSMRHDVMVLVRDAEKKPVPVVGHVRTVHLSEWLSSLSPTLSTRAASTSMR